MGSQTYPRFGRPSPGKALPFRFASVPVTARVGPVSREEKKRGNRVWTRTRKYSKGGPIELHLKNLYVELGERGERNKTRQVNSGGPREKIPSSGTPLKVSNGRREKSSKRIGGAETTSYLLRKNSQPVTWGEEGEGDSRRKTTKRKTGGS